MNVKSVFLDPKSLEETGGYYGVVSGSLPTVGLQSRFTEQYLDKNMLVYELQDRVNAQAERICELNGDCDQSIEKAVWLALKAVLDEVKAL